MVPLDVRVPPKHVKVIRSNLGLESGEKCRDVQNEAIWADFRKKAKAIPRGSLFKTPLYFLETEESIFKTLYNYWTLNIWENIQIIVLYILINIKRSSYNRISKSKKNRPFIK
jgi:hypothetical protein